MLSAANSATHCNNHTTEISPVPSQIQSAVIKFNTEINLFFINIFKYTDVSVWKKRLMFCNITLMMLI